MRFLLQYLTDRKTTLPDGLVPSKVDPILHKVPRFWEALWEIRTPFLDSLPRKVTRTSGVGAIPLDFFSVISSLAAFLRIAEEKRRCVKVVLSQQAGLDILG